MARPKLPLTGPLARAARALVEVSVAEIAGDAGVSKLALRDFERGLGMLSSQERKALRRSLERYGAHFVADGKGGRGYGVRLKFSAAKTEQIEGWEDEGGLAARDDV